VSVFARPREIVIALLSLGKVRAADFAFTKDKAFIGEVLKMEKIVKPKPSPHADPAR
jgi:hypothetical protein